MADLPCSASSQVSEHTQQQVNSFQVLYNETLDFAEKLNGRLAMIGLVAAVVNYGFTGWITLKYFNMAEYEIAAQSFPIWKAVLWVFYR